MNDHSREMSCFEVTGCTGCSSRSVLAFPFSVSAWSSSFLELDRGGGGGAAGGGGGGGPPEARDTEPPRDGICQLMRAPANCDPQIQTQHTNLRMPQLSHSFPCRAAYWPEYACGLCRISFSSPSAESTTSLSALPSPPIFQTRIHLRATPTFQLLADYSI